MDHANIILNDGRSVSVEKGQSLFFALRNAGIFIPTICGGNGFCGKCKVRVVKGDLPKPNEEECNLISDAERADGYRLACQIQVQGDLEVELPGDVAGVSLFTGEVTLHELVAEDIMRVQIHLEI